MQEPLAALVTKRDAILREMAQTGDMRRGSITEAFRPCGKANCACSQADHPGHGPYLRLHDQARRQDEDGPTPC